MKDIPLIEIAEMWHIGSLDPSLSDPTSFEGCLLSVSTCPDTWQRVARLSGPLWKLSNPNASYLNAHVALENAKFKQQMLDWAHKRGLVDFKTVVKVSEFDDEMDANLTFSFDSYEDAEEEFDMDELQYTLEQECPVMTDKALEDYSLHRNGIQYSLDYILIDWARQVLCPSDENIKGIYWADAMDPSRLSAPRGGIFPDMMDHFELQREEMTMSEIEEMHWGESSDSGYHP